MNFRIIDVNINRVNESVRVIEDIMRFEYDDVNLVEELKIIRHKIKENIKKHKLLHKLLKNRDIEGDKGKFLDPSAEFKRDSVEDIIIANFKRAEESSRVLEETTKIIDKKLPQFFKKLRFQFYDMEKITFEKYMQL